MSETSTQWFTTPDSTTITMATATNTLRSHRQMETMERPQESQPQPNTYRGHCRSRIGRTRSEPSAPTSHQISCWYNNLANEGDRSHWYQDKDALHNAQRVSPQVQHHEAVREAERERPWISEGHSHDLGWDNKDQKDQKESTSQRWSQVMTC